MRGWGSNLYRLLPKSPRRRCCQIPETRTSRQGILFCGQVKSHPGSWWQLVSIVSDQAHDNVPYKLASLKKDFPGGFSERDCEAVWATACSLLTKKTTVEEGEGIVSMSNKSDARWSRQGPQAGGGK